MPTPGIENIRRAEAIALLLLLLLAAVPSEAQTKCPPLAEGSTCGHYHYHVLIWQPRERIHREITGRRQFVSLEACEKAKAEMARENLSLAELMKTSIDSAFQPDHYRDCHCDRTADLTSGVFQDTAARIAQMRIEHEAVWTTREKLLASDAPRSGEYLQMLFGREVRADRFLRKAVPSRLPEKAIPAASATLLDTKVGGAADTAPIAANLSFINIPLPGGAVAPARQTNHGSAEGNDQSRPHAFFTHEVARADAILTASEKISEPDVRSAVRGEVARRKRVLENLRAITSACDREGPTIRAIQLANDEAARLTVIRGLFGNIVVRAWAPTDARDAAATTAIPTDAGGALVFDATADVDVRRATLYAALGRERQLSQAETITFAKVVEELVSK